MCDVSPRAFVKSFLFPRLFCPLLRERERDAFRRAHAEDEDGYSLLETDHLSKNTDTNYLHTQA